MGQEYLEIGSTAPQQHGGEAPPPYFFLIVAAIINCLKGTGLFGRFCLVDFLFFPSLTLVVGSGETQRSGGTAQLFVHFFAAL